MIEKIDIKKKLENLKNGDQSCIENVQNYLQKIKENEELNIFLEVNKQAEERAKELDKKRENNEKLGKLYGLTIAVKSVISVQGMVASCASKTLENYKASYNADVIEKILAEDAIIIGIVNNDEFASGSSGETSAFGNTINPQMHSRIPGGSSSGSAAAVSAGCCDIALGTDTGGSIRNPASHCNIHGLKPSYGAVSRYGLLDLSMSLDCIGPLCSDVYGMELMFEVIAGKSTNDATSRGKSYSISPSGDKKYKIGIMKEFEDLITHEGIKELYISKIKELKEQGHTIKDLDLSGIKQGVATYYPIVYSEFYSGTRKYDGLKYGKKIEDNTGEEALRRLLGGKEISKSEFEGAFYKKALKMKEILTEQFTNAFEEVDFIFAPVTPRLPHKFGEELTVEEMYGYDAFTVLANLTGICAGVVTKDCVKEENEEVPVGFQIMGNILDEKKLFEGLYVLESL